MIDPEIVVEGIYIADTPGSFVSKPISEATLNFGGIPCDRHFGITFPSDSRQPMYERGTEIFNRRQLSVLSVEECQSIAEELELEQLNPEWIGANLLIKGLPDLTSLPRGTRILFPSGAGLICEGENMPCVHAGKEVENQSNQTNISTAFVKAALHKRGIVCSVEREGTIQQGDRIRLFYP